MDQIHILEQYITKINRNQYGETNEREYSLKILILKVLQ